MKAIYNAQGIALASKNDLCFARLEA